MIDGYYWLFCYDELLLWSRAITLCDIHSLGITTSQTEPLPILRRQSHCPRLRVLLSYTEELRIRHLPAAVRPPTTREQPHLGPRISSRIHIQARLRERTHYENGPFLIIMDSLGDDVPALTVCRTALGDLHRREVGAEVAGLGVHEQAAALGVLDLDVGEGAGGCVVALVGLVEGFLVEDAVRLWLQLSSRVVVVLVSALGLEAGLEDEGFCCGEGEEEGGEEDCEGSHGASGCVSECVE